MTMRLTMPRQFLLSYVSSDNLFNVYASFKRSSLIPTLAKFALLSTCRSSLVFLVEVLLSRGIL